MRGDFLSGGRKQILELEMVGSLSPFLSLCLVLLLHTSSCQRRMLLDVQRRLQGVYRSLQEQLQKRQPRPYQCGTLRECKE
ncbi:hypothetical protein SK128_016570 [Halocaridina rubra]|uniref:Uncharacterized protein n=1 Tax=Halocaridina rubra TaxID=373956 RepID=A0AAN9FTV9_HALRR